MNGLQRYRAASVAVAGAATLAPDDNGDAVLFADVEPALRDAARFKWLEPVVVGRPDDPAGDRRGLALFAAHRAGHRGLALVDAAMEACPE